MTTGFRDPKVLGSFIAICLIWGSTWVIILDQIGEVAVPPPWSVAYRFAIAAVAMLAYAAMSGASLRLGPRGHLFAMAFGIPQFAINYNLVYAAEAYVTSGLVATMFALLMVPNSALAWLFLKQRATLGFIIGSAIACVGVALLFVQEARASAAAVDDIIIGTGLGLLAVLCASVANVLQAGRTASTRPMASLLAWGMVHGAIANILFAFAVSGAPVLEPRIGYWIGLLYLALAASALAFSLYFVVLRAVGPGKAAYSGLVIPIVAMGFSTVIEGYRWSPLAIAGGLLALAGMAIALRSRATKTAEGAPGPE